MISTKQANAIPSTRGTSSQEMPGGRPTGGKPRWTVPTTLTPCAFASVAADTMIDSTTATIAPGIRGENRLNPSEMASVPAAKPTVGRLAFGMSLIQSHCCSSQRPSPFGTPSMSGICPPITWIPTPVRKPISTDADRKSPRKPSRSTRAMISIPPQTSAVRLVKATHSGDSGVSPATLNPASPAARIAAVAESAPTTSSFDDPSRANTIVGKITV